MAINVPLNAQLQNATQLQQQIQNAVNSVRINLGGQNGARALSSLSQPLGRLTGQADEFTKSLDAANARVLAFGASVGVVNAVTNAFKSLVNSTIEVEKAITAISVVGDQFTGKTKELSQGLFKIAKETGQSFSEVSKAALEFSRQGLQLEDTLSRTQDALVLTRLTGLDAAKSVDGLTAAFNAFSKAGLSTTQIVNKLAAVDQAFAVSSADLIEGFNRSAAVAQNAGVTFDELAGIITALQQETSRGGAVIGNALKTIFTRLQDTSTLNNLQNLGVAVQDLQGNILPARQILQNLATDVEGLGQITKAGIFKDVAGTFQINQLISLVGDLNKENSIAAAATLKSAGATNQAYVANEKLNQSLDAILNKVANTGKQLGSILGELGLTDNLKGLLDGINSFLDGASSLLQGDDLGSNFAKGFVKGIGAVLSGPGLGIFLAIIGKLSLDLAKFGAQSLKAFFGIGKAAADQKLVQESIVQTLLKNQSVLSTILNTQGGQNAQALKFLGLLNQQATAMQAIQGLAGGIASTVYSGGFRATAGGLQRKAAGGYLPAQEASDVSRGVGGASPSSKVVSIPNFAFGGGKRGTMIANTSEYIVPNYAGGGSAIFNQDMVKSIGLPAGAKKISAAGGFVPNFKDRLQSAKDRGFNIEKFNILYGKSFGFLRKPNETAQEYENIALRQFGYIPSSRYLSYKTSSSIDGYRFKGDILELAEVKADEKSGLDNWNKESIENKFLRGIAENYNKNSKNQLSVGLKKSKAIIGNLIAPPKILEKKGIPAQNIARSSNGYIPNFAENDTNKQLAILGLYGENGDIDGSPVYTLSSQRPNLFKDIKGNLQKNVTNLVKSYASRIGKKINVPVVQKDIKKSLDQIPSVSGFIFEDVLNQLAGPNFDTATESSGSRIDFPLTQGLREVFGVTGPQKYAEAKLDPYTSDAAGSVRAKQKALAAGALGPQERTGQALSALRERAISLGIGQAGRGDTKMQFKRNAFIKELIDSGIIKSGYGTSADQTKAIKRKLGMASGGYIPNFAAAALQQAIAREKSAGLSNSQIYVDQDSSLKSSMNPMGLMVANRRDEPAGGFQGIARARKEGVNPKLYGAANGFVPNYVKKRYGQRGKGSPQLNPSPSEETVSTNDSPEINIGNVEGVNKGFGDMAGKIIILQSALTFLSSAVGEGETSMEKFTQQLAQSAGNITSLGFLFQQIAGTETKTKFGGFIKNLGLVGTVAAGVYEGFKLIDYGFKEFSGQNKRTADALAKLETAAQGAIISLEDLTPEGQRTAQETGKAALEAFSGSFLSNLFSQAAGKNPRIQEQAGLLAAQGFKSQADFQKIVESKVLEVTAKQQGYKTAEEYTKNELEKVYGTEATAVSLKDLVTPETISAAFEEILNSEGVKKSSKALFGLRSGLTAGTDISKLKESIPELENIDPKIVDDIIKKYGIINERKKQEQEAQNKINFGERLSLEIAKKRVDSVLEIAKLQIQATNEEEAQIQLQEQTLELSNRQKIVNEARLKQLDLEKKKQTDIVDSIGAAIDKAQQGGLSVSEDKLKALQIFLGNIDFSKVTDANFDGLAKQLADTYLDGNVEQAQIIIKSVKEEQKEREKLNAETDKQIDAEKTRKLQIDGINQSLASQLSTIERIASTAASIGNLNISGIDLESAKTKAQITRLQAQLQDPNLTEGQKNAINTQINGLEKINNLNDKRKASEDRAIKTAEIEGKIKAKTLELEKIRGSIDTGFKIFPVSEEYTEQIKNAEASIANFRRELQVTNNAYDAATLSLDANNAALDIQASQIGKVAGAYASLNQQLEAFRLGAGGRVGSAMLDELGATDINSLMQARIKQNVEADASGLNDKDRYKTVQEETRLRQIQFDLATAESVTRKRELEYELKYTKELIDLKNQGASDQELIDARNRQISEQRSGGRGFEKGLDTIQDRINNYRTTLGEEIPNLFSSNLAQGLNDAISGAKDLKTALTDAATAFFQEITRKNISNLADMVTGGIGKGASSGGGILSSIFSFFGGGSKTGVTAAASGGMIKGGSGTKDDVPAMLMGGEYVVKKSAVNKYGKGFLDAINSGSMRGYATGGMVDPQTFPTQTGRNGFFTPGDYGQGAITGKNELLTFASQSFTGGQYDYMGGFGMGGASVSLEPESARLSAFGRENSPMFERVQQSKDEAFKVYLEGLQKEKEYAELLDQIAKDKKARKKQLQSAIISAVISSALSYAGTSMKVGAANASAAGGSKFAGAFMGSGGKGGLFNIAKGAGTSFTTSAKALEYAKIAPLISNLPAQITKQAFTGSTKSLSSSNLSLPKAISGNANFINPLLPQLKASGGLISGGSNIRDDVPAMLTGGEFVLNNRATQRIGVQNLNQLNNGQSVGGEGASSEMTQALISKLDELIQATQNSSSENVVVNVSSNESDGQNQQNPAGAEKELHKKIRQAVLDVIAQEKRLGGSLEKSR
jgi:TP901 family phage tail tape measure protein